MFGWHFFLLNNINILYYRLSMYSSTMYLYIQSATCEYVIVVLWSDKGLLPFEDRMQAVYLILK